MMRLVGLSALTFAALLFAACDELPTTITLPDLMPETTDVVELPIPDVVNPICPDFVGTPPANPACEHIASAELVHRTRRSGAGLVTRLRLEDERGLALDASYSACLEILDPATCEPMPTAVGVVTPTPLLALLVAPGSTDKSVAQALDALGAIIAARPDDQRIALFRWADGRVTQIATFTNDGARLRELAAHRLRPSVDTAPLESVDAARAVEAMRGDLLGLAPETFDGDRTVIVVAPSLSLDTVPWVPGPSATMWLLSELRDPTEQPNNTFLVGTGELEAALSSLVERIDDNRRAGLFQIGQCLEDNLDDVLVRTYGEGVEVRVEVPDEVPEDVGRVCDPEALAADERVYPQRISFSFTEGERAAYDQHVAESNEEWFQTSLQLWDEGPSVLGRARLRGQSSLGCARKSYSVNLTGQTPRELGPGFAEFYLIAMCLDDRYINQITADTLLKELGIFDLDFRVVEVTIDGVQQGMYLLLEKPQEEMLLNNSRVRSIVRRDTDIDGKPAELKYPEEPADAAASALAAYDRFLENAENAGGEDLIEGLLHTMDLRQYLRWIALMSLLENGDYVDEVYFMSTESTDTNGQLMDYYTILSWDPDDLFSVCHHSGRFAIDDTTGLLYCTESILDHAIFAHQEGYAFYTGVLEEVLDRVTQTVFDATVDATVEEVLSHLSNDDVRLAMVELLTDNPGATDFTEAERDIRAAADVMKARFTTRRAALEAALEAFQSP